MPRREIKFVRGGHYHLYNRGANRMTIFRNDENYRLLLHRLRQYSAELEVKILAYCLLPNHYHWCVRQDGEAPAGLLAQRVFNSYGKAFNNSTRRTGTIFEDRYRAIMVETDSYLLHLCRYIHANPVRHGIAADVALWPYSNYLEWIERRQGTLVDMGFVRQHFATADAYKAYVQSLIAGEVRLPQGLQMYLSDLEDEA